MEQNNVSNQTSPPKRSPLRRFARAVLRSILLALRAAFNVALLLPIPIFILWYSYSIDRNGWFQGDQYEREVALAMLDGNAISNFEKMDERQIVKLYAQNLPEPREVIAIGSSRVLQLTDKLAGSESYFNAGMIGAEQPDVMSTYYLFDRAECLPETVIFCVDPWVLAGTEDALTYTRVDKTMYTEFLYFGLGHTDVEVAPAEKNMAYWLSLTSPAFFRENVDYYIENKENGMRPNIVQGNINAQRSELKMRDGTILYTPDFRSRPQEEVNESAYSAINASFLKCEYFDKLSPAQCRLFDEFVRYMQRKGSRVILLLSPYHPIVYDTVLAQPERYSGFFQVETWLRDYAEKHSLPLYGSYDPEAVNCTEADFFDAWHVRGQGIAKYFPGVDAALPYDAATATLHRLPETGPAAE